MAPDLPDLEQVDEDMDYLDEPVDISGYEAAGLSEALLQPNERERIETQVPDARAARNVNRSALQILLDKARREAEILAPARESLYQFVKLTKPDLEDDWFIRLLCEELQQFYEDVMAGKQPRVMIFAPPRHGKTEIASRRFPAWCFGKNPRAQFIATSYAAMLAARTNRDVQRIMDDELYKEVFPETRLNVENVATVAGKPLRNSEIFEIVKHLGAYRSAGIGGGITGQGFQFGLIDDPIADAAAAFSEPMRNAAWEWYRTTFYTRQAPDAGILMILTRWHADDMAGRALKEMEEGGDKWRVVKFPAVAEEDETYRKKGEPLMPKRYNLQRLAEFEKALGSYAWACMYQQRPGPRGGTIFTRSHWKFWRALPQMEESIISVDCSFKEMQDSDFVAIQVWGRVGANKYLMKRTRERMGFAATVLAIRAHKAMFPDTVAILVEDKANGSAVIETLKVEIAGVLPIEPEGGKVARAYAIQPEQEAGNLWLPDPSVDPTIETYLGELSDFPSGPHDDETDSTTQAINWYKTRVNEMGMLEFYEREYNKQEELKRAVTPTTTH